MSIKKLGSINVLYASQTGKIQSFARRFASEIHWRLGVVPTFSCCDNFAPEDYTKLNSSATCFFFVSSHGSGMPADTGMEFWNAFIEPKDHPHGKLSPFHYGVFGRGSSIYNRLNRAARCLDERLSALGAMRLSPYGEQDAMHPVECEAAYDSWKNSAILSLSQMLNLPQRTYKFMPTIHKAELVAASTKPPFPLATLDISGPEPRPVSAKVLANTDRLYVHADINLPENTLFQAGDHLIIWPSNQTEEVATFLRAIGRDGSQTVEIDDTWSVTLQELAEKHLSINSQVTVELLRYISQYSPDEETSKRASELANNPTELRNVSQKHFNLGRLMIYLSGGKSWDTVPVGFLIDTIPPLHPRAYSISSSPVDSPRVASMCSVLDKHGEFEGVTTSYLSAIARLHSSSQTLPVAIRDSGFHLPPDPEVPLIMIALGTGVAPYRGFIKERMKLGSKAPMILIVGARTSEDLVYWREFEACPNLTLIKSLTREPGLPRQSLRDVILDPKNSPKIFELLKAGAKLFNCGSREKMLNQGALPAITEVIAQNLNLSMPEASKWLMKRKKAGLMKNDMY